MAPGRHHGHVFDACLRELPVGEVGVGDWAPLEEPHPEGVDVEAVDGGFGAGEDRVPVRLLGHGGATLHGDGWAERVGWGLSQ